MDILHSLKRAGAIEGADSPSTTSAQFRPQTISEMLDGQISFHEKKIADLKEAKAAISPDVERALNALAKL